MGERTYGQTLTEELMPIKVDQPRAPSRLDLVIGEIIEELMRNEAADTANSLADSLRKAMRTLEMTNI